MKLFQRSADRLNIVIQKYLEKHGLLDEHLKWKIGESKLGGFGVFVTTDIDVGEVIFKDFPVILGPRCAPNQPQVCLSCFGKSNLQFCAKGCGLQVCSQKCKNNISHQKLCELLRQQQASKDVSTVQGFSQKLYENLTPTKSLLLDKDDVEVVMSLIAHNRDRHGHEVDTLKELGFAFKEEDDKFIRFVCCVLDANAFEVSLGDDVNQCSFRGLFPLGSLINHSCVPNTLYVFNKNQQMVVQAATYIPKNTEIFYSYIRLLWGTTARSYHLHKTKHFVCKCDRCKDPTEFGTNMSSVLCKDCMGIVSPVNPHKAFGMWRCGDCKKIITGNEAGETLKLLGSILRGIRPDDFNFMIRFLRGKLRTVVPENNQVAVELKYKIIWVLGHKNGYKWHDLSLDLLKIKEDLCNDILYLLEKLRTGKSRIKGILLYELFRCQQEIHKRDKDEQQIDKSVIIDEHFKEAAAILRYDVAAPEEIKSFLNCNNPL